MNKLDCAHLQFESDLGQKHSCSPVQTAFYLAHEMRSLNSLGAAPLEVGTVNTQNLVTYLLNLIVTHSTSLFDHQRTSSESSLFCPWLESFFFIAIFFSILKNEEKKIGKSFQGHR